MSDERAYAIGARGTAPNMVSRDESFAGGGICDSVCAGAFLLRGGNDKLCPREKQGLSQASDEDDCVCAEAAKFSMVGAKMTRASASFPTGEGVQ